MEYYLSRYKAPAEERGGGGEVRQLPDQAPEHLHRERGGGGEAGVRDDEVSDTEHVSHAHSNVMG